MSSEAEKAFNRFAVFGESSSNGTELSNKNFSKLCKDCGIMDGKAVTPTDVDTVFSKVKAKNAKGITFQQFQEAVKELGQKLFKEKTPDEVLESIYKLMEDKDPAATERFDESGKGKDIKGWEETTDNSGYMSGYKGAGIYDKKSK